MMAKARLDDLKPIKVTILLQWFNARTVVYKESIETTVDVRNPGVLTITSLPDRRQAKSISIEIYFDHKLMCYAIKPLESSELLK